MKKILILFFLVTVVCGCSVNYELEIRNNEVYENMTIIETDSSLFDQENDSGWTMRDSFNALIYDDEFAYRDYKVKLIEDSKQLGIKYSRVRAKSLEGSSVINQCYSDFEVRTEGNIVTIDTGDEFECYELYENLDSIKVVFKTNHKVIYTNADYVEGNKYIWDITESGNKNIKISYDKKSTTIDLTNYGIVLAVFAVLLIVVGIISIKVKNKNNI